MEKLALEIFDRDGGGSKFAILPSDTNININVTSEIFDSGDVWTYAFKLKVPDNAHIFGSAGEMHGSRLHEQIDKRRARLWVLSLPLYYGYIRLGDEVDVEQDGYVDISFESGRKTFYDRIEGAKANQVPLMDEILIGMALDRERTVLRTGLSVAAVSEGLRGAYPTNTNIVPIATRTGIAKGMTDFAQQFPKYVRPSGVFSRRSTLQSSETIAGLVNKDHPYGPGYPYCNTRICYQQYEWKQENDSLEKTATRQYRISEPGRINPSPNFFVLYWLDCLMKHLNIYIEENQMLAVEDLKRLFFVNTKCAYTTKNDGSWVAENSIPFGPKSPGFVPPTSTDDKSWELKPTYIPADHVPKSSIEFVITNVGQEQNTEATWHKAYATSGNFPASDIKDVIEALENGFGMRLLFNDDHTKVRVVLLRNILGSQEVHEVPCEITEQPVKQETGIRGFRLTYGGSEEDTNYVYKGFVQAKQKADEGWITEEDTHDYSQWDMTKHYADIKEDVRMLNKTCYVDMTTGNAYVIKIDENWKNSSEEAFPSIFTCADFMDAEDGDCTGEDETVKEIRIGFSPLIENIIPDGYALFVSDEMEVPAQELHLVDGSISPEPLPVYGDGSADDTTVVCNPDNTSQMKETAVAKSGLFEIATATHVDILREGWESWPYSLTIDGETYEFTLDGWLREGYRIYMNDNYKAGEDLDSPFETHDWGLTLGVMRGSGSGAHIDYDVDEEEKEGNDCWTLAPGSNAFAHSDTCDDTGHLWDYDGSILVDTPALAKQYMSGNDNLFPDSNINLIYGLGGIERSAATFLTFAPFTVEDDTGKRVTVLAACGTPRESYQGMWSYYTTAFRGMSVAEMYAFDRDQAQPLIAEIGSSAGRAKTLNDLQAMAFSGQPVTHGILIDNGVGSLYGRFSLKLRAEKPNPYYNTDDSDSSSSDEQSRYLPIGDMNLQHRGLMDQFHREESYWWRNAKTAKLKVRMELAQLVSMDKTVRQKIGDITGFVKKMQYSVDMQSGLSDVTVEMWYL